MIDLAHARLKMVERQIADRGIFDERILQAMRQIPRDIFVAENMREFAYEDSALPIDAEQSISQPYIVASMIDSAEIKPGDRVLEIGAGSGYAASVISRIAAKVYAIERHENLAATARSRLAQLGYTNVEIQTGDGTFGWPEVAPFDAIIVSAGAPRIPTGLRQQLSIGGRLVVPVGDSKTEQQLIKVKRIGKAEFAEEKLELVRFVPLIGADGWREPSGEIPQREARIERLQDVIRRHAIPLPLPDNPVFADPFQRFGDARVLLLGECSHGTSEFYQARAAITRRLIEKNGFNIVALEADWPDAATLDRYVRSKPIFREDTAFRRFPTWMWRNTDVEAFIRWLRTWNMNRTAIEQVGLYGFDLYNLNASIKAVLDYLDATDPQAAAIARNRYACLMPWAKDPQAYGRIALNKDYTDCEEAVVKTLKDLLAKKLEYTAPDGCSYLNASGNARLVKNAEAYYRAMYYGAAESWNLRDTHMFETLEHLMRSRPDAKAIVWAHNSHIGDASKTEMGMVREELNIGQLCREKFGRQAALIGFGTHSGTVACADDWDGPLRIKQINPSLPNSYERLMHDAGMPAHLLDFRPSYETLLNARLSEPQLERFIGVIYRPETERWSHYAECKLAQQFDAYVWIDQTTAVTPLETSPNVQGEDDTYPFGL